MEDFTKAESKIVIFGKNPNARRYLELPFFCDLTSYGNNIVASVSEELMQTVSEYVAKHLLEHCFETLNLIILIEKLMPYNLNIYFMTGYFLPEWQNAIKSGFRPIWIQVTARKADFIVNMNK
ncbi:MAG TPA: hypothetical protein VJZ04_09920 [Lachnospiraceae bacterium]|nr:hypothetical protein [Lachnospiraceae bacterium]